MTSTLSDRFLPRVHRFVLALAVATLGLLAANTYALFLAPPAATWETVVGTLAFIASFITLERVAVSFVWRGHRTTTALTETAVYLGLVLLSPHLVVLLAPLARTAVHFASGRPPIKGVFNVSHEGIAAGVAAAAHLLLVSIGWAPVYAAAVGTVLYSLVADSLVAELFAILEGVPVQRVYIERFAGSNALAIAAGIPAGLAFYALFELHPLAILAAVPILLLLLRTATLQASADRELIVRRRLGDEAHRLVGVQDEEMIARHVLKTALDLLDNAGRVRLTLADGRSWEEATVRMTVAQTGMSAPILAHDGTPLGVLEAWERPMNKKFGEEERLLLTVISGKAAHSIDSARALAQVAAQRDLIARQEKLSALGTLLAGVAHEVNNPLSYMRLRLELTRMEADKVVNDPTAPEEAKAFARKIHESVGTLHRGVERLAGLSHSLKVVARPGDGQRRPTDLNDVVQQVMTILRAAEKEVHWEVDLAPSIPLVEANAGELHQVVLNLAKNAVEALHGQRDAKIHVATREEGGSAVVVVQDNGPGIPEDIRPRLFTPFFTTKDKGTGLGLSISHQIVSAHGGKLELDTGKRGTTFTIRLPVPSAAPAT